MPQLLKTATAFKHHNHNQFSVQLSDKRIEEPVSNFWRFAATEKYKRTNGCTISDNWSTEDLLQKCSKKKKNAKEAISHAWKLTRCQLSEWFYLTNHTNQMISDVRNLQLASGLDQSIYYSYICFNNIWKVTYIHKYPQLSWEHRHTHADTRKTERMNNLNETEKKKRSPISIRYKYT